MNKPRPGVWITCQNTDCINTHNPDHVFLVPYRHRDRRFCCNKCASLVRSNTPEWKETAGEKLRQANKVRHLLYPEWVKNSKNAVSKMLVIRNKTQEMRDLSGRRLAKANQDRKELYPEWCENQKNAVSNMFQDPKFLAAHKERASKIMINLHQDPKFVARRNKRASETIIKYNLEDNGNTMRNSILNRKFGFAQRLLYSKILESYPELAECFKMEHRVLLTDDIVNRYSGSNKSFYQVDISYIINDKIQLAIEVDGLMGHSTDDDIQRDKIRDNILLFEFGIGTVRVRNEEVLKDVDMVVKSIIEKVNQLNC